MPSGEEEFLAISCQRQARSNLVGFAYAASETTYKLRAARLLGVEASIGNLVAKLSESSHEQWWRFTFLRFYLVGPSVRYSQSFVLASGFAPGRTLRQSWRVVSLPAALA
ncbi:hypothetical protein [Wenzhouxiangella sp. EGI_FJ10409]|uniref:hypothetical protein n=1 Tax=Wenzhouxiangella sp. EGI_FJ10409 TaxID=3243767 RepID=UPI0035E24360